MGNRKYPLRVVPWWTPEATRFIANLTKWYPCALGRQLTAFEVGSGNSTAFLLSKGLKVTSVETDPGYLEHVKQVAEASGYSVNVVDRIPSAQTGHDLTLVLAESYDNRTRKPGYWYTSLGVDDLRLDFDLLVNDGVERMFFMRKFSTCHHAMIVVDNCEYAANWGRLTKSSAKPDLATVYRAFLRDPAWQKIIFEQPEGREGRPLPDPTGAEASHRWNTTVAWHASHLLNKLMVTNLGLPLVNLQGEEDVDLTTLQERCPFDWNTMQWGLDDEFPSSLDLGLNRSFE